MSSIVRGLHGKSICELEDLRADDTVASVKAKIEAATGFSASSQKLSINGRSTKDDEPISDYLWKSGDPIRMLVLAPCARKTSQVEHHAPASPTLEQAASQLMKQATIEGSGYANSEYGYLQIDGYAKKMSEKKSKKVMPGPKYWVSLPAGTRVESYPSLSSNTTVEVQSSKLMSQPRCSSLSKVGTCTPRSTLSDNSDSTTASSSDRRQVHFSDGVVPCGSFATSDTANLARDRKAGLSEVIYIDRDICGFSLYEYAPANAEFKDFASSRFARLFLEQLSLLESDSQRRQYQALLGCRASMERYQQEERELDKLLMQAGVKAVYLQPESQCQE